MGHEGLDFPAEALIKPSQAQSNRFPTDDKLYGSAAKFRDIPSIDARLNELEQEKQHLIVLKDELQKPKHIPSFPESFSPEQKIAIFKRLFRGRTDIFANRWQNQQGRSGYSVTCSNWVNRICN